MTPTPTAPTTSQAIREQIKALGAEYLEALAKESTPSTYCPPSGKVVGKEELANMLDASLDMWLTTGRFNDAFEAKLAQFFGRKYALTTNSGSSANLLAISALTSPMLGDKALKPGDEVITVAAGFPTTVNPIIQNNLVPVFVDVELGSYNMNVAQLEEAFSPKTRAVFIAHTLGNVFDLTAVKAFCETHDLWLIEDNCDALGAKFNGQLTGTFGHISTLSFYPAHHMTMGEGGAMITNDSKLYRALMSFRDWGRDCWCPPGKDNTCGNRFCFQLGTLPQGYDHKYTYSHMGYNLKITDWQAACGLAQLDKVQSFIEKRRANFDVLYAGLKELEPTLMLPKHDKNAEPSWFGFAISVAANAPFSKNEMVEYLEKNGVGTRNLFAGNVLRQPAYLNRPFPMRIRNSGMLQSPELTEAHYATLPMTDEVMKRTFWIGVWPGLTQDDLNRMIHTIKGYVHEYQ
jgi:CDP-4-dehydro-6-deoxyglucose reductase, E1